jgi:hypothetical protein
VFVDDFLTLILKCTQRRCPNWRYLVLLVVRTNIHNTQIRVEQPLYSPGQGLRRLKLPRFLDSRYMKVVRLSSRCTVRLYPPGGYLWYSFLLHVEATRGLCCSQKDCFKIRRPGLDLRTVYMGLVVDWVALKRFMSNGSSLSVLISVDLPWMIDSLDNDAVVWTLRTLPLNTNYLY